MLGEALRLLRTFHDLNQTETARRLGISKSYLSEIESEEKQPTLALLEKYSVEFDIPISSIMFFAESVGSNTPYEAARSMVAPKIVKLLKFIEEKTDGKRPKRRK
ncbi:transcriptional regulator with XRE-family HTH domain [Bradyrhizobium japonicum]|uniref:helix-turn-helix domain-containing protein n=1 Tax=Bradyrhizobium TaxID=374 RepID=UPI0004807FC3|nr:MULTISPECIES: helix-turn-helix transcriptional regulator [Bradyrhizobium]WLB96635.1 helix-turn-helix transcriptional regulator [Bradyrhizobium japonicum USDA 123]MBR0877247.1 helix-turn-helix transcriptional regulator [Bradyrhizobium liaoningense]MBR0946723.1 helix-turn-helix transcriptional regulator [Bradyrhizobium liaoningense]MBR0998015.1 helix-turn-helix transcriptional regulator [Bradyrhizobium liaoningense]MBR1027285.1 helix-turn-helix transcriptional regulator [Bradyrhizobium liaoni